MGLRTHSPSIFIYYLGRSAAD